MSDYWAREFGERMASFRALHKPAKDDLDFSIKIRVEGGCFHREHSPAAYDQIDSAVRSAKRSNIDFSFEEHESGPEILVYMAVTAAGLQFATAIINLITAILKARSDGIRKGDRPNAPLKVILRQTTTDGKFREEEAMTIESHDPVIEIEIEEGLRKAGEAILKQKDR